MGKIGECIGFFISLRVKYVCMSGREPYRPFAPATPASSAPKYSTMCNCAHSHRAGRAFMYLSHETIFGQCQTPLRICRCAPSFRWKVVAQGHIRILLVIFLAYTPSTTKTDFIHLAVMENLMDDNNGHSLPPAAEVRKETTGDLESSFLADHDDIGLSLPSAEEVKSSVNTSNRMQNRWKYFGIAALVLLGLIIGTSVGASKKKKETTASSITSTGTENVLRPVPSPVASPVISPVLSPVISPVLSPSMPPAKSPAPTSPAPTLPASEVRFKSIIDFLSAFSDPILLNKVGTAQNKAANWLGSVDTRQYPVPSSAMSISAYNFVQRYVLALLYLALDGDNWEFQADFLTEVPECGWTKTLNTDDGDYNLGVTCDAENEITTLFFRKYLVKRGDFGLRFFWHRSPCSFH